MRENLLKRLTDQQLLSLAVKAIDDFMALSAANEKDEVEKKRDELNLLNKILQDRELKKMVNPS